VPLRQTRVPRSARVRSPSKLPSGPREDVHSCCVDEYTLRGREALTFKQLNIPPDRPLGQGEVRPRRGRVPEVTRQKGDAAMTVSLGGQPPSRLRP